MLLEVEERVGKLKGSIEDMKESIDVVMEHIDDLREQPRDFVIMSLNSNMEKVQELLNSLGIS